MQQELRHDSDALACNDDLDVTAPSRQLETDRSGACPGPS
ncbi:hypothetical protein F441_01438 [Phytophthora nicotianae CJ01A1]|uniref:Uncharacterized protein n=5 Tax=Phytophthora nicotianae TaxID=4792 RepID=W2QS73_PHYN3|nr:hypothetical protein PPTG_21926 [Phytophthora nicotianae INRA-310]ETI55931.1 hypothetical protein F443_01441 [Phytophthora nicotianae P1569]ETO84661.1 hypothetical protein F444_01454 [Phytophthora nicotianae P1976]ETP25714.1 hypothetical protein F441_01438 [Phytophthora nicotianae CJ01A1]ETP53729.1 hypothetical protein F442_01393 [Phytophthora nicotianae P10297]ETN15334.1 hypothetical protein PPTG_21926 [Phytophthora nicotianae INRA-310]